MQKKYPTFTITCMFHVHLLNKVTFTTWQIFSYGILLCISVLFCQGRFSLSKFQHILQNSGKALPEATTEVCVEGWIRSTPSKKKRKTKNCRIHIYEDIISISLKYLQVIKQVKMLLSFNTVAIPNILHQLRIFYFSVTTFNKCSISLYPNLLQIDNTPKQVSLSRDIC